MIRYAPILCAATLLAGCSASSPFIVKDTTTTADTGRAAVAPYDGQIFVTDQALPAAIQYQVLGAITVGSAWYGSSEKAVGQMVDKARQLGANAIIDEKVWWQPSGFSWAAPHASGRAIRIQNINKLKARGITGDWY